MSEIKFAIEGEGAIEATEELERYPYHIKISYSLGGLWQENHPLLG